MSAFTSPTWAPLSTPNRGGARPGGPLSLSSPRRSVARAPRSPSGSSAQKRLKLGSAGATTAKPGVSVLTHRNEPASAGAYGTPPKARPALRVDASPATPSRAPKFSLSSPHKSPFRRERLPGRASDEQNWAPGAAKPGAAASGCGTGCRFIPTRDGVDMDVVRHVVTAAAAPNKENPLPACDNAPAGGGLGAGIETEFRRRMRGALLKIETEPDADRVEEAAAGGAEDSNPNR